MLQMDNQFDSNRGHAQSVLARIVHFELVRDFGDGTCGVRDVACSR